MDQTLLITIPFDDSVWERCDAIDAWMAKLKLERIGSGAGGGERDLEYEAPDLEPSKELVKVLIQAFPWIIRIYWDKDSDSDTSIENHLLHGESSDGF